jgi:predicted nucleic acid-binding Zn ribbon protein
VSESDGGHRARARRPGPGQRDRRRGDGFDRSFEVRGIERAVADVLRARNVEPDERAHAIVTQWVDIVGERIARRTWPDGLERGVLWVRVSSSTWMHQLGFVRAQIVERTRKVVRDPQLVREVRFHLGGRRPSADDVLAGVASRGSRARRDVRTLIPATGAALARIRREASVVVDEELRAAIVEARRRIGK